MWRENNVDTEPGESNLLPQLCKRRRRVCGWKYLRWHPLFTHVSVSRGYLPELQVEFWQTLISVWHCPRCPLLRLKPPNRF